MSRMMSPFSLPPSLSLSLSSPFAEKGKGRSFERAAEHRSRRSRLSQLEPTWREQRGARRRVFSQARVRSIIRLPSLKRAALAGCLVSATMRPTRCCVRVDSRVQARRGARDDLRRRTRRAWTQRGRRGSGRMVRAIRHTAESGGHIAGSDATLEISANNLYADVRARSGSAGSPVCLSITNEQGNVLARARAIHRRGGTTIIENHRGEKREKRRLERRGGRFLARIAISESRGDRDA
jgi:hypothetical protein